MRFAAGLVLALVTSAAPFRLRAQPQATDTTTTCDGGTVQSVAVETNRPRFRGALAWWRKAARAVGLHHETTSRGLVRRFVSLDPGRRCTEFRRSESERILRAQPYIADATVATVHRGDSIHVDVSTVDEVPVIGSGRFRGAHIEALSLGTVNFLGAGMHVEGRWEEGRFHRDGVGGKFAHTQVLGRPYSLTLEGTRRPVGEFYTATLGHAFLTDLQRVAWHSGYGVSKDFARLRRGDRALIGQPVDRALWDVGGVLRVGPPRKLLLLGGMLLGERVAPRSAYSQIDTITDRFTPLVDTAGVRRYAVYDATSIAGVLGVRALAFKRMHALDALAADQDVATGVQVGALLGQSAPYARLLRQGFATIDAYVGGKRGRHFAGVRTEAESRFSLRSGDWRHIIVSGRAAWYMKVTPQWTSELSAEGAGGWNTIIPFQFELGDRAGGVRGYVRAHEPGAQRLVLRLEQRMDLGRFRAQRAAYGVAAFADAGRMWAGDVPFGVDTKFRASAGVAILAAVPARSQRTIRGEFALPFDRALGARPEMRFLVREPMRGFWSDPPRVRWARLSAAAEQIFSWP